MKEIIVVPHAVTELVWREPGLQLLRATPDVYTVPIVQRTVSVRLEPGESRTVQIGAREYVTVRRPR